MADEQRTLTANFTADSSGFARGADEVVQRLRQLNTSLEENKQKIKSTNNEIKEYQQKLNTLKSATDNGADATEEQRREMQQLEDAIAQCNVDLGSYRTNQQRIQTEIRSTNRQLNQQETATREVSIATTEASNATSRFMDILSANLLTGILQNALSEMVQLLKSAATYVYEVGSSFEAAMSQVAAVSGASEEQLAQLTEKAKELGASTKFTATEAAEALNYMAMAGWKTEQMLSGIDGVIELAAASGEDLGTVSDIVTDALTAFGLAADDSARFANILAAAASNSNTNVSMMGETFSYCAPIAGSLGFTVEDTAVAIGIMANSGIKASQAGTALRTIMTKLADDVTITGDKIGEVTIATSNADGTMREFSEIIEDLRTAFGELTESEKSAAAESIAGKYAMSGFLSLMNAGASDVAKLTEAIDNADGAAASMADTMQNNLSGKVTIMKSALEGLGIELYDKLGDSLTEIVENITEAVTQITDRIERGAIDEKIENLTDTFVKLSEEMSETAVEIIPEAIGVIADLLSMLVELKDGIGTVGGALVSATVAYKLFNTVARATPQGLAITALSAAATVLIPLMNELYRSTGLTNDEYDRLVDKTAELTKASEDYKAAASNVDSIAEEYKRIRNEVENVAEQEELLRDLQADLIDQYGAQASGIDLVNGSYENQLNLIHQLRAANEDLAKSTAQAALDTARIAENQTYYVDTKIENDDLAKYIDKWIYENLSTTDAGYTGDYENIGSLIWGGKIGFTGTYADRAAELKKLYDYTGTLFGQGGGIYDEELTMFRAELSSAWAEMGRRAAEIEGYESIFAYRNPSTTHSTAEYEAEKGKAYLAAQQEKAAAIKEQGEQEYEALKEQYDAERELANDQYSVGEISAEEYYDKLLALRESYLDKTLNAHDWYTATKEIQSVYAQLTKDMGDATDDAAEKIKDGLSDISDAYKKLLGDIDRELEAHNRTLEDEEFQQKIDAVTARLKYERLDELSRRELEKELADLNADWGELQYQRKAEDKQDFLEQIYTQSQGLMNSLPAGVDATAWSTAVNAAFQGVSDMVTTGNTNIQLPTQTKVFNITVQGSDKTMNQIVNEVKNAIASGVI